MKRIYLVRHGETEHNAKRLYQPADADLNDLGLKQAEIVAERLKDLPIQSIICSTMPRTKQTANFIADKLNLPVIYDPDIREASRPTEVENLSFSDPTAETIVSQIRSNQHDPNYHFSNEENLHDVSARVVKFLKLLESMSEERILVVTHGMTLRFILFHVLFGPDFDSQLFSTFRYHLKTTNTGITVLEYDDHWVLRTWNDYSHLP